MHKFSQVWVEWAICNWQDEKFMYRLSSNVLSSNVLSSSHELMQLKQLSNCEFFLWWRGK